MVWLRNNPGTKWLEIKCVQVNMYVIIFKRSYMRTLGRSGKYHKDRAFAYCYQDCGSCMRRQGAHWARVVAICERNSMRLHIAASLYLFLPRKQKRWPLVGGAHPYIPNMLQNSCRNRNNSYTVARWSYYVVLIRTNVVVYRSISYKLETDRAKLL